MDLNEVSKRLSSDNAVAYFTGNGHRIATFRALLDLLSIPHPYWAVRSISGTGSARRKTMLAYQADYPEPRQTTLPPRKANATPEKVQIAKAASQARLNPSLFSQTFPQ